jgi:hypothetical protein
VGAWSGAASARRLLTASRSSEETDRAMTRSVSVVLAAACLAASALFATVWFHPGRDTGSAAPAPRTALASLATEGALSPLARPESDEFLDGDARVRAADDSRPAAPAPDEGCAGPASVVGSLRIDGELQERGEVELRDASGSWSCTQALNYGGKFRFDDVPSGDLVLAFEIAPGAPRRLLAAPIEVGAAAGEVSALALDLQSTEINVRVLGSGPGWSRARVEIEGPGLTGSIETDENGKCALALVGKGRFAFRATTRAGRRGEVALELAGDEGLQSVVISTEEASG